MGKVGGCKQEYKMDINSGSTHSCKEKTWSYSNIYGHHIANNTCSKQDDYDNLVYACK